MSDNIKTALSALTKLQQNLKPLNRLVKPSYFSLIEQIEHTLEPIRRQQLIINRALEMSEGIRRLQELSTPNQNLEELKKYTSSIVAHQSWIDQTNSIQNNFLDFVQIHESARQILCDTSLKLTATEQLMAGINFEAIRQRFQIDMPIISELEKSILHVNMSYGSLVESLLDISNITGLPAYVLPGATREIYTTNFVLKSIDYEEQDGYETEAEAEIKLVAEAEFETSGCINLLQQIDPELARPYIGAKDAFYCNNADRERHILSSLRELWNHLLRRLAPDDLVRSWIFELSEENELLHEGKPTRRARVLYVCRKFNNEMLSDFVISDTKALVKFIELFNRVHELNSKLTDEQLKAILLKTDSWLTYIIQISEDHGINN